MSEWRTSCYIFKTTTSNENNIAKNISATSSTINKSRSLTRRHASSTSLSYPLSDIDSDDTTSASTERKEIHDLNAFLITCKEKPLRLDQQLPTVLVPKVVTTENNSDNNNDDDEGKDYEFVWAKKYRPQTLDEFICNHDKAMTLLEMLRNEVCGHFIFEGPPGVGKRTMIMAMLRRVFKDEGVKTREVCKTFNLKGETSLHVNVKESLHHLEINLNDIKGYEKNVIVELIQGTDNQITNNSLPCAPENCRAIILYEADKLSSDALLYLKWLFERYDHKGCNKVFFCCSDASKLQPNLPLCNFVKLSPPSKQEIVEVLEFIARKEGLELPHQFAENIAERSKKNLRQAIRSFEATWRASYPFKENEEILTGWEQVIASIAKKIVEEQTPRQLYEIRVKLRNLTDHDISAEYIFETLAGELKKLLPENLRYQVDVLCDAYNKDERGMFDRENPSSMGRNRQERGGNTSVHQFLRIEEFIAMFMSWCKDVSITNNKALSEDI